MDENGGLGDASLFEFVVGAGKHYISDVESEDFVGTVHQAACFFVVVIEVFAHSYELGTLTGEYKSFHFGCQLN